MHASITLIEGWTFNEVMKAIYKHPHITKTSRLMTGRSIRNTSSRIGSETSSIEGWIFPHLFFSIWSAISNSSAELSVAKEDFNEISRIL